MWRIVAMELRERRVAMLGAMLVVLLSLHPATETHGWAFLVDIHKAGVRAERYDQRDFRNPLPVEAWGVICPVMAGMIALAKAYKDKRQGTWPLLAHLPVPRTRVVFGRFYAGLLMYLIFTLFPMLLMALRLMTPGVWPGPVNLGTVTPLIYPVLGGIGVYTIAFYAAFRPARWYGTKLLPLSGALVAGIAGAFVMQQSAVDQYSLSRYRATNEFLPIILIALAVSLLALWGIYETARTREY